VTQKNLNGVGKLRRLTLDIGHVHTMNSTKVMQCRNRSGVVQRVPEGLGSQILMTFSTWSWWGQPHAPAVFIPRKFFWYSFSI